MMLNWNWVVCYNFRFWFNKHQRWSVINTDSFSLQFLRHRRTYFWIFLHFMYHQVSGQWKQRRKKRNKIVSRLTAFIRRSYEMKTEESSPKAMGKIICGSLLIKLAEKSWFWLWKFMDMNYIMEKNYWNSRPQSSPSSVNSSSPTLAYIVSEHNENKLWLAYTNRFSFQFPSTPPPSGPAPASLCPYYSNQAFK